MNPFTFFVTLVSLFRTHNHRVDCYPHHQSGYTAFMYNFLPNKFYTDATKNVPFFTACPASTKEERTINKGVSITKKSLFLRKFYASGGNITLKICDEPVEPGIIYNLGSQMYEIGYEFYYEQDKLEWEDGSNQRNNYRSVNINYEVIDDPEDKLFIINASRSSKLIFYWMAVLSITWSEDNKQILFIPNNKTSGDYEANCRDLKCKCEDHKLLDKIKVYISSEGIDNSKKPNQIAIPDVKKLRRWYAESHGSLKLSQIIPLWYFGDRWAKAASCSHMNMIPVWKIIAERQLRKVDLYLQALIRVMKLESSDWIIENVLFGASGVLTVANETYIDSDQRNKMYAMRDNDQQHQIIPIPKIIYRVIEARLGGKSFDAVIIIHNDPNAVPDDDRICNELEEVPGWETIKNNDLRTGLTYVCHFNNFIRKVVHDKLSFHTKKSELIKPLNLEDERMDLNDEMDGLKSRTDAEFEKVVEAGIE